MRRGQSRSCARRPTGSLHTDALARTPHVGALARRAMQHTLCGTALKLRAAFERICNEARMREHATAGPF